MLRAMEPYMVFDYMGIHLDSNAAQDLNLKINVNVTGDTSYLVTVKSGVLLYQKNGAAKDANATITIPKQAVALLISPESDENGLIQIEGDTAILQTLAGYMAEFDPFFNIIEP